MKVQDWINQNSEIVGDCNAGEEMIPLDKLMQIVRMAFVVGAMSCGEKEDKAETNAAIYIKDGSAPFIYGNKRDQHHNAHNN